jgi:LPS-assembly lipoprotein
MWLSDRPAVGAFTGAVTGAVTGAAAQRERRRWLYGAAAAAGSLLALGGCGFQLRQPPRLGFASMALQGFGARSTLAQALREQLAQQLPVLEDPQRAAVVLQALDEQRDRIATATTAAAQVRELQLRLRLVFRVYTPAGRELIPRSELLAARALSYREAAALAKEYEEQELFREMQADLVGQLMRRLAAVTL